MASLVLGAIGGFFFGPIGWMVGSLIGNLLFPGKGADGPRLNSLKLMGSSYGRMIPITYGTVRLPGEVVWRSDLTEHKHSSGGKGGPRLAAPPTGFRRIIRAPASSGGKGGPSVTTYTYTASFAVKLCKGPKGGVSRLWGNGTIIYDTTGGTSVDNSKVPLTVYLGIETDNPDPTMEAVLGVGNVPAFRDDCTIVFTDMELGNFGNTLPQLNAEVFDAGGPIPWRVSTFTPWNNDSRAGFAGSGPQSAGFENGEILLGRLNDGDHVNFVGTTFPLDIQHVDYQGNLLSTESFTLAVPIGGFTHYNAYSCANNPRISWAIAVSPLDPSKATAFYYNGEQTCSPILDPTGAVPPSQTQINNVPMYSNDAVFACGGNAGAYLAKWSAPGGSVFNGRPIAFYSLPGSHAGSFWMTAIDDGGEVWVCGEVQGSDYVMLHHLDADLNVIRTWNQSDLPSGFSSGSYCFTVWNGYLYFTEGASTAHAGNAYKINGDGTFTLQSPGHLSGTPGNSISLGNGYVLIPDGVASLLPQSGAVTLASIVSDLSVRAGLTTGQIDVTQLTDLVDGYIVSTQADCRTDIEPLRSAYFFDGVESGGIAKFVKRGGASVVSIPANDLAAQQRSEQGPPIVEVKRAQEVDLPAVVNVTYMDVDAAYQDGSQQARRQVTLSQSVASVQLAIVMNSLKARQVASVLLFSGWMERTSLSFRTSRKYDYLEPTDIVTLPGGYQVRITRKMETVVGVLEFEALQTFAALYVAAPAGNPTSGYSPPPVTPTIQPTDLLLLDIPLVVDTDDPNGFYSAMAGRLTPSWGGGVLYISRDAGTNYSSLISDGVADTFGTTSDALGDWQGGDVFDPINTLTVVIGNGGGALANATMDAVINGANGALVGNEIIQYMSATLTAPNTYVLSNLLRGRHGTEWATSSHAIGDRFVVLPVNDVAAPFSDLTLPWLYKAVSSGDTVANTSSVAFTNTGTRLRCYAPVQLGGGRDGSGNLFLQWNRRTRIGGLWLNNIDALLSETLEAYHVYIYTDNTYATVVRTLYVLPANFWSTQPSVEYDAALQTIDFGSPQSTVYWSVAQIGTLGDGTIAKAST